MKHLIEQIIKFRDDRNWGQFHNPKDLAIALNVESAELTEKNITNYNHRYDEQAKHYRALADCSLGCSTAAKGLRLVVRVINSAWGGQKC